MRLGFGASRTCRVSSAWGACGSEYRGLLRGFEGCRALFRVCDGIVDGPVLGFQILILEMWGLRIVIQDFGGSSPGALKRRPSSTTLCETRYSRRRK